MDFKKVLSAHSVAYPHLLPDDIIKLIFQSSFGCEHMVSSLETAGELIKKEIAENEKNGTSFAEKNDKASSLAVSSSSLVETLGDDFSRISLQVTSFGLSKETLAKLFYLSALDSKKDYTKLQSNIEKSIELAKEGGFPFSVDDFLRALKRWEKLNYPPIHHSANFKKEYTPSYRVISNKFVPFLPLFCEIDKKLSQTRLILSIEGGSASGKTTLSNILKEIYQCNVFHTDDFFLQPHQRTKERLEEVGGNLDRERFLAQVVSPLTEGKVISYKKFDCSTMKILPSIEVRPSSFSVVEGAYSMHPFFLNYYNLSVFLDIDEETQKERIQKRNSPQMQKRFFEEWIPMEKRYFGYFGIKEKATFVISKK